MASWSFLTNHAKALLCIHQDPEIRLRDIAAQLGITERSAFGIVNELVEGGYVVRVRSGRRNNYLIQGHFPLPDALDRQHAIGAVLDLLLLRPTTG